jgi:hypothetical protein
MPLATGTLLGNYEIVDPLGKDGMGAVTTIQSLAREIGRNVVTNSICATLPTVGRVGRWRGSP